MLGSAQVEARYRGRRRPAERTDGPVRAQRPIGEPARTGHGRRDTDRKRERPIEDHSDIELGKLTELRDQAVVQRAADYDDLVGAWSPRDQEHGGVDIHQCRRAVQRLRDRVAVTTETADDPAEWRGQSKEVEAVARGGLRQHLVALAVSAPDISGQDGQLMRDLPGLPVELALLMADQTSDQFAAVDQPRRCRVMGNRCLDLPLYEQRNGHDDGQCRDQGKADPALGVRHIHGRLGSTRTGVDRPCNGHPPADLNPSETHTHTNQSTDSR